MPYRLGTALLVLATIGFTGTADAGKLGTEFRVNTETGGDQEAPAVATLASGDFVIVWKNFGQSGQMGGMYFQRYTSAGVKLGGETRVNSATTSVQFAPSVAALQNGNFVVVWTGPSDGSGSGIFMQRFTNAGARIGAAVRCNVVTTSNQATPSVSALTNGGYFVAWRSSGQDGSFLGVYGRRFLANGNPVGSEFRLNTQTFLDQGNPRTAGLSNGEFIGTWDSDDQDGDGFGIYAQRYFSGGGAAGIEFRANAHTAGEQFGATVAALTSGRFIIGWHSLGQDGSGWGVYAQRYKLGGAVAGVEFRANTPTAGDQMNPAIAGLSNGGFVIAWEAANKDGSGKAIVARKYNADGTASGAEFRVNTFTNNDQITPAIAALGPGRYVIAWVSVNQDGSGYGVYAQRFGP